MAEIPVKDNLSAANYDRRQRLRRATALSTNVRIGYDPLRPTMTGSKLHRQLGLKLFELFFFVFFFRPMWGYCKEID
jgi:hypothetical protein